MGCLNSTSASADKATEEDQQMYYDPAQELIAFDRNYEHLAANELKFISEHDQVVMRAGDECYVISVAWLNLWLEFVKGNRNPPKGIDNKVLIDSENNRKLRRTIVSKKDYRPVCKAVWEFYFVAYGGGPIILFHVPSGLEENLYKSGEWLKFVKLEEIVSIVYPVAAVDRISFFSVSNPMSMSEIVARDNTELAASLMMKDLGKSKMKEAHAMQGEINETNAELIGSLMAKDLANQKMAAANELSKEINASNADMIAGSMARDLGNMKLKEAKAKEEEANKAAAEAIANQLAADMAKKQMEEARKKEEEANKAAAEAIANQLAADMAKKQMEEARKKEEEANKAAAEAIANQLAGDMAKKQMEAAREIAKKEQEEQERRLMETFKSMGAKMRFRAAVAAGKNDVAEEAAAMMLQGAWRSKLAKRRMELQRAEKIRLQEESCARRLQAKYRSRLARKRALALRAEKIRLQEESCARRLQAKYRARLARKKVLALRAEKERLMEESCARRLQCKYRSRLARRKMQKLREEKQRLMEEGCAIKLQGTWRTKKARRKVEAMKAERQRLREEACAIKLQAAWRIKKARAKVERLKAEKQRLLMEGAAMMFQSAWRVRKARQRMNGLKQEKGGAVKLQRRWKTVLLRRRFLKLRKSSIKIEKIIRGLLARRRMARMVREFHPHNLVVVLRHARDLNVADINTSDPYVIVSGHHLQGASKGAPKSAGRPGELFSFGKSKVIPNSLNPTWNEEVIVTSMDWNSQLTLTLMDSDMVGAHDFLGQATVLVPSLQSVYSGAQVECADTPLTSYDFPVSDGNGKPLVAPGTTTLPGKGNITFAVRVPSLAYNMCGWVLKNSTGLMTKGVLKKRWMVLLDFKLRYYDSQFSLDEPRGEIHCSDITALVEEDSKKDGKTLRVNYGKGKDYWVIKVDPEAPKYIQQMWLRKLVRCCQNIPDRELLSLNSRAVRAASSPNRPPPPLKAAMGQL